MITFDLQLQSTVSDGKHAPRELVRMAKDRGVRTIALTDHDAVDGIPEVLLAGGEFGVRMIPGIEMSVEEHNAHILGYGFDHKNPRLLGELERFRKDRIEGAQKITENLRRNEGFTAEWEDVLREASASVTITRPHIVRAIMKREENQAKLKRDGVKSKRDFFDKYLSDQSPNFVKRAHILAKDAIALLHEAGGVAVWSHPVIPDFKDGNYEELEKFWGELVSWNLDGLEVFSPSHTEDDVEFLQGLAARRNFLYTAGSDFHEEGDHPADPETGLHAARFVGDVETYGFEVNDIVEKLDKAIQSKNAQEKSPKNQ